MKLYRKNCPSTGKTHDSFLVGQLKSPTNIKDQATQPTVGCALL